MHSEFIHLCDHASQGEGGKVNIVGLFEAIGSESAPVIASPFCVVCKLVVDSEEEANGKVEIGFAIRDPDGVEMVESQGLQLEIKQNPYFPRLRAGVAFIANIAGLPLRDFGDYKIEIYSGEKLLDSVTLKFHKAYEK